VPGTFDFLAFDNAFTERSAGMRACIINGIELATEIEQANTLAFDFDTRGRLVAIADILVTLTNFDMATSCLLWDSDLASLRCLA